MKCTDIEATLEEFASGELEPAARAAIEAHVEGCASCARGLGQVRRLEALLEQASLPALPDGFFERQRVAIFARLSAELDWQAPKLSLLMLSVVFAGYVFFSMAPLMDWVHDLAANSRRAWSGVDGIVGLYGLMLVMGVLVFNHEQAPSQVEARQ